MMEEAPQATTAEEPKRKKKVSEALLNALAKARAVRAAKLRAAKKGMKAVAEPDQPVAKPKRKMSAAQTKALSLVAKARWAKAKRAGKSTL